MKTPGLHDIQTSRRGAIILSALLFLIAAVICAAVIMVAPNFSDMGPGFLVLWLFLGLLPGLIIGQHAILLANDGGSAEIHGGADKWLIQGLAPIYRSELRREQESRSPQVLLARFGIPALCTVACAILVIPLVMLPDVGKSFEGPGFTKSASAGMRFGGMGAYVYVLQHLGQRYFQRDVTTGGALWCAINLILGPLLGAAMAELWVGGAESGQSVAFAQASVYFLAGLAPRFVIDRINDLVRRFFVAKDDGIAQSPRTLPLTRVRGITSVIEERFYEEGIFDLFGLAMANPFRLIRRTPYDKRQIASWIDEALLITFVPDSWMALEREGITGASDLASYAEDFAHCAGKSEAASLSIPPEMPAPAAPVPAAPAESPEAATQRLIARVTDLAKSAKIEPIALSQIVKRLSEDSQVLLVWGLYQFMTSDEQETEGPSSTNLFF